MTLSDDTREMLSTGAERIYGFGHGKAWDGEWLFVLLRVPEERRDVRHRVRTQLAWAGFGSLGAGVWVSPHVDREVEIEAMARQEPLASLVTFRARLGSVGEPSRLLSDAWDLGEVAVEYRSFIERFRSLRPKSSEQKFRAQTELVNGWRRFPFLDPELPERYLPSRWPRTRAVEVFEDRHAAWEAGAQGYFSSIADFDERSIAADGGDPHRPRSKSSRNLSK